MRKTGVELTRERKLIENSREKWMDMNLPMATRNGKKTFLLNSSRHGKLKWAGKTQYTSFEVDEVSLHIHERISTRAILDAVRRPQPVQLELFGETPFAAHQYIEFYRHEVGWANRLSLGVSILVKEGMAGKMQMIYIDPPCGIKYASNFQPRIDRRKVKDKDEDLPHEPEQMK